MYIIVKIYYTHYIFYALYMSYVYQTTCDTKLTEHVENIERLLVRMRIKQTIRQLFITWYHFEIFAGSRKHFFVST